jgi:hypothetical protein
MRAKRRKALRFSALRLLPYAGYATEMEALLAGE